MRARALRARVEWVSKNPAADNYKTRHIDEREVEVRFELRCSYENGKLALYLAEGGVTGHESFVVDDMDLSRARNGWTACAGTPGSWDRLFVPAEEMQRVLDAVAFVRPVLEHLLMKGKV